MKDELVWSEKLGNKHFRKNEVNVSRYFREDC